MYPPQGNCESVMEALILANSDIGQQCARRGCGLPLGRKSPQGLRVLQGHLAEFWKVWSEYGRPIEQPVTWADVKSNIVVKEVADPATSRSWKIYEAALVSIHGLVQFGGSTH